MLSGRAAPGYATGGAYRAMSSPTHLSWVSQVSAHGLAAAPGVFVLGPSRTSAPPAGVHDQRSRAASHALACDRAQSGEAR